MDEVEIYLVREYVHLNYLIKEAVSTINGLKVGVLVNATKSLGSFMRARLKVVEVELRKLRILVHVEDDGSEVLYVVTNINGVKGRHGIKRRVLLEDLREKLDELTESVLNRQLREYKPEMPGGDPYAHINKPLG